MSSVIVERRGSAAGQFLYIEPATGQPIAAALARELTARTDEASWNRTRLDFRQECAYVIEGRSFRANGMIVEPRSMKAI
jgi:hypothetical protein